MKALMKSEHAEEFKDLSKKRVQPGKRKQDVEKYIDLNTIAQKVNDQEYASAKKFKKDVEQIFSNVRDFYGGINSSIGRNSINLRESYEIILEKFYV